MHGERADVRSTDAFDRYRAVTAFHEELIVYDRQVEGAWIQSDTWLVREEYL